MEGRGDLGGGWIAECQGLRRSPTNAVDFQCAYLRVGISATLVEFIIGLGGSVKVTFTKEEGKCDWERKKNCKVKKERRDAESDKIQ